jgi:hypothetical protein
MILDRGIATISRKQNTAPPGAKPIYTDAPYWESWYGELEFETSPARPTNAREEVETGARVRVLQNRAINNHDRVTLSPVNGAPRPYEVTRAYHGRDDESGELITDLTLEEVSP